MYENFNRDDYAQKVIGVAHQMRDRGVVGVMLFIGSIMRVVGKIGPVDRVHHDNSNDRR